MKYQAPRGTQDILPKDSEKWQRIIDVSRKALEFSSFKHITIPIFEHTELFQRSVGESSDIVNKEMYTFSDRSDRSLTLRPEATAGIVRAYIEGLQRDPKPVKLWTYGPMFRYERSQTGRYRQFHQIDAEVLGDSSTSCEIQSIYTLSIILNQLEVDYTMEINSLGDKESKDNYRKYLKDFAKSFLGDTCDDCKRRYEQNPLRMLDCKVQKDQDFYSHAKKPVDFLSAQSDKRWEGIKKIFKPEATPVTKINYNLVRGLDYYNDFVFEIKSTSDILKGQSTICAGGRYDSLVESLGGPDTPGFGWAIGIERLMLILKEVKTKPVKLMFLTNQPFLVYKMREIYLKSDEKNLTIETDFSYECSNIGKQIEAALRRNFNFIIFYLEDEVLKGKFKIKNLQTKEEVCCTDNSESLIEFLQK